MYYGDFRQPLPPEEQRRLQERREQIDTFYQQMEGYNIRSIDGYLSPEDQKNLGTKDGFTLFFQRMPERPEYTASGMQQNYSHSISIGLQKDPESGENILVAHDFAFIPTERSFISRQEAVVKFTSSGSEYTLRKFVNKQWGPYFDFPALTEVQLATVLGDAFGLIQAFWQLPEDLQQAIRKDAYQRFTPDVDQTVHPYGLKADFKSTIRDMRRLLPQA